MTPEEVLAILDAPAPKPAAARPVPRTHAKHENAPLDVHGRKMERCQHCGQWAPKPPLFCLCMEKCQKCAEWFSTDSSAAVHEC